jgi:hypothetical protein
MNLSIVVPLYKSTKHVYPFLRYFKKNIKFFLNKYEINFVCDEPNNKDLLKILKKIKSKNIKIIVNKKNYGLSISAHIGIRASKYKNIFLTQPDLTERVDFKNIIKIKKQKKLDFIFTKQYKRKNKFLDSLFWKIFYPKKFFNICITTFFSKKIYFENWKKKDFGINLSMIWLRVYKNKKNKTYFLSINKLNDSHKSSYTFIKKFKIVLNELYFRVRFIF